MLVRAGALARQRLQTEAIGRLESDGNSCSHAPDSHAFRPTGNPLRDSNVRRDPLAQRLADEAALIPRRAAILERLHEREQQQRMMATSTNDVDAHGVLHYSASSATRP